MANSVETGAELIVVRIAGQQFAIDIMSVREIRGWSTSTPLPHAPEHVLGMVNLRGQILPVIDFAARLGLGVTKVNTATVVIVTEIGDALVGLLVDEVCDILTIDEAMLQPAPDVGEPAMRRFVRGVITADSGIITLLSLDAVLPEEEILAA